MVRKRFGQGSRRFGLGSGGRVARVALRRAARAPRRGRRGARRGGRGQPRDPTPCAPGAHGAPTQWTPSQRTRRTRRKWSKRRTQRPCLLVWVHGLYCTPSTRNVGKPLETPWKALGKPWETLESLGAPELRKSVKPWQTLGRTLENPWNGFWEHLGRGQAAGRPGADKGKHKGNTMVGRELAKPWNRLWEAFENVGETLGKTLETPRENLGNPLEEPWGNLGNPLEGLGKTLGKPWNRPAAEFWMTAAGACARRERSAARLAAAGARVAELEQQAPAPTLQLLIINAARRLRADFTLTHTLTAYAHLY
eukprot:gene17146-biopygen10221